MVVWCAFGKGLRRGDRRVRQRLARGGGWKLERRLASRRTTATDLSPSDPRSGVSSSRFVLAILPMDSARALAGRDQVRPMCKGRIASLEDGTG